MTRSFIHPGAYTFSNVDLIYGLYGSLFTLHLAVTSIGTALGIGA